MEPAQATAQAVAQVTAVALQTRTALREEIKTAECVDPRRLAADPKPYEGKAIRLQGRALTVTQQDTLTWLQFMADVPGRRDVSPEAVVVVVSPKNSELLRGERYWVWGTAAGTAAVTLRLTGVGSTDPAIRSRIVGALDRTADELLCG